MTGGGDSSSEARESGEASVPVARFRRLKTAEEHALVVLAMKLPYWLMEEEGRYVLYVETEHAGAVRDQLRRFNRERRYWPPVERTEVSLSVSSLSLWAYVLVLGVFFWASHRSPGMLEVWFSRGGIDAGRILDAGELWRLATALTLHTDIGHLAGNLAGGALFAFFLVRVLGSGFGWLLILASGVLGNAINVAVHAERGHLAVGASTAVFGTLGLLAGWQLIREWRTVGRRWPRRLWIPLGGGLVLLGFLGAGGERTDVLAHLWGFAAGFVLAVPFAWNPPEWIRSKRAQVCCAIAVLFILGAAWVAAWQ